MKKVLLALSIFALMCGCNCNRRTHSETKTTTTVAGQSHLLDAKDFDLQSVMTMVKENKVGDAESLEEFINKTPGINNVDVEPDGNIDYISVKERRHEGTIYLDLMAIPSSTKDPKEALTVASVRFTKSTSTSAVEVSGGYPNYVHGYGNHYYNYHRPMMSVGDAVFLAWMFSPRPLYHYPMGYRFGYVSRPVYTSSQLRTHRTTVRKQVKVSPIKKSTRPKNYKVGSAKKVPSRFKKKLSQGSGFKGRSGTSAKFNNRTGKTNRKAKLGSTNKKKSSGWGSTSKSKSRSWGGSSKSSGWGSSKKKSSGWGSSSGSRSWGGSRSSGRSRRRSDVSFKTDIVPITNALDKISLVNGVYFRYKTDKAKSVGVIAQELKKVLPEAVSKDSKGYMVDYVAIIPLLIEGMKELQLENQKIKEVCKEANK